MILQLPKSASRSKSDHQKVFFNRCRWSFRAILSWVVAQKTPFRANSRFPPTWEFGNFPFFFNTILIAKRKNPTPNNKILISNNFHITI